MCNLSTNLVAMILFYVFYRFLKSKTIYLNIYINVNIDNNVTIDNKLKFARHITSIITKANQQKSVVLGCFYPQNLETLFEAFKVHIWSLLEYASAIWLPSYVGQIICLKGVRRDFTKRSFGCCQLGLETLELWRSKFDILILFNIIKGNNCLNLEKFFTLNQNKNWRGHSFKIVVHLSQKLTPLIILLTSSYSHMKLSA